MGDNKFPKHSTISQKVETTGARMAELSGSEDLILTYTLYRIMPKHVYNIYSIQLIHYKEKCFQICILKTGILTSHHPPFESGGHHQG
jgi:hypothetical protein